MPYQPTFFDKLPADRILKKRKGAEPYVFDDDIVLAVDVALATKRPLLVSGRPGSGKSRLAEAIAAVQEWNFLGITVTSRTRLETLTAEVDQLRRLNDAQARLEVEELKPDAYYLKPGVFWWAFQAETAQYRGLTPSQMEKYPDARLDYLGIRRGEGQANATVLLIDEIDKAEPDLPNDLLEPLDRRSFDLPDGFRVNQSGKIVRTDDTHLLTLITTNGERQLPQAFLRRCVLLELPDPYVDKLVAIAEKHFPKGNKKRIRAMAELMPGYREAASDQQRRAPGTSEFLDAVEACERLKIEISKQPDSVWKKIENAILLKKP